MNASAVLEGLKIEGNENRLLIFGVKTSKTKICRPCGQSSGENVDRLDYGVEVVLLSSSALQVRGK